MIRVRIPLLLLLPLLLGCGSRRGFSEGTVEQATTNTLTVITDDGECITFLTKNAPCDCPVPLHAGSPVRVAWSSEPKEGFGTAERVSASENYNRLIGVWVEPNPINAAEHQGFVLYEYGEAESVNMHTLLYGSWSVDEDRLTLRGHSVGNGIETAFTEEWCISFPDGEHLILRSGECERTMTRTEYPQ